MARYHYVALSDPVAGRETEFDRWYETQHIPDILAVPGFVSAQRFWAADSGEGEPRRRRHLVIYEIESEDPESVFAELRARRGTDGLRMSGSLDHSSLFAQLYLPAGEPLSPTRSQPPTSEGD